MTSEGCLRRRLRRDAQHVAGKLPSKAPLESSTRKLHAETYIEARGPGRRCRWDTSSRLCALDGCCRLVVLVVHTRIGHRWRPRLPQYPPTSLCDHSVLSPPSGLAPAIVPMRDGRWPRCARCAASKVR